MSVHLSQEPDKIGKKQILMRYDARTHIFLSLLSLPCEGWFQEVGAQGESICPDTINEDAEDNAKVYEVWLGLPVTSSPPPTPEAGQPVISTDSSHSTTSKPLWTQPGAAVLSLFLWASRSFRAPPPPPHAQWNTPCSEAAFLGKKSSQHQLMCRHYYRTSGQRQQGLGCFALSSPHLSALDYTIRGPQCPVVLRSFRGTLQRGCTKTPPTHPLEQQITRSRR
nr:PREDICTED: uncharacterized protein LOC102698037 isoform X3 [Lepisosteus oculatus]